MNSKHILSRDKQRTPTVKPIDIAVVLLINFYSKNRYIGEKT